MKYLFIILVLILNIGQVNAKENLNGYLLPPEPSPKPNNTTLKGIDSNKNGIRDDVERKIVAKYKTPIKIELMLLYARMEQKVLLTSVSKAIELTKESDQVIDCEMYLLNKGIEIDDTTQDIEDMTLNTKLRKNKYAQYENAANDMGAHGDIGSENGKFSSCNKKIQKLLK
jgi:hypothetical protein